MRLAEQLRMLIDLPAAEIDWFVAMAERRRLAAGEVYCRIGQDHHEFGVMTGGIMQIYGVTSSGDKVVLDFVFGGMPVLALEAAIRGAPSEVEIEAVVPTDILVWPYELRLKAFERHPKWRRFEALCLEQAFVRKHQRYLSLRTETSEERYRRLAREFPPEWSRIPKGLIASYLNITPQYLSRLRRQDRERSADMAEASPA